MKSGLYTKGKKGDEFYLKSKIKSGFYTKDKKEGEFFSKLIWKVGSIPKLKLRFGY